MVTKGLKDVAIMCILRAGDDFLLLKRNKEPNLGKYACGHVDPHETPRQAAIREVLEETGYLADAVRFCGVLAETSPRDYNWVVFIYSREVKAFSPPVCDEGTLEWVPLSRIAHIPTPATDMYIYQLISKPPQRDAGTLPPQRDARTSGLPFVLNAEYDQNLRLLPPQRDAGTLLLQNEFNGEVLHHEG